MVMKRIDSDDDQPAPQPKAAPAEMTGDVLVPGLLYRGVPQDRRRLSLRIDPAGNLGVPVSAPPHLPVRRSHRELTASQLYFG